MPAEFKELTEKQKLKKQKKAEKKALKAKKLAEKRAAKLKNYHWRPGDRRDGRKVRSLTPLNYVSPYIMPDRMGASNFIRDSVETFKMDEYIYEKRKEGYKGFGALHVFIAAYVRMASQRPGVNRFINRQKIYARHGMEIMLVVKKELKLNSQETVVKIEPKPDATAVDIYKMLTAVVEKNRSTEESSFDSLAKILNYIPGLFLKFVVWFLRVLDYFDLIPRFLTKLSPFHGSMFITSMASLGIPPIYHHLYDFGNVPLFLSYGAKRAQNELDKDGNVVKKTYIDFTYVCDERICDGHYYASALKIMRECLRNPYLLDSPPEQVVEDIW